MAKIVYPKRKIVYPKFSAKLFKNLLLFLTNDSKCLLTYHFFRRIYMIRTYYTREILQ